MCVTFSPQGERRFRRMTVRMRFLSPTGERTKVRPHWPLARALSPMNRVGISDGCASLVAQTSSLPYRRHLACTGCKANDPWHSPTRGRLEVGDTEGWET